MENLVSIILALLALIGNCGWIVSGRKYKHEVRKAQIEANQEDFQLSKQYIDEFKANVYKPLYEELQKLRAAIEKISSCAYYGICPVLHQLQQPEDTHQQPPRE